MFVGRKSRSGTSETPGREVLPLVVVRRVGLPPKRLDALLLGRSAAICDRMLDLETQEQRDSAILGSAFERLIGLDVPLNVKRELISLRRDIYNHRMPKQEPGPEVSSALSAGFTPLELANWRAWLASRTALKELVQQGETTFVHEMACASRALKQLARNPEFLNGLALASPVLSEQTEKYLGAPEDVTFSRRRRMELGLVRYLSRCSFKLSPFSSFMHNGILRITDAPPGEIRKTHRMRLRRSVKFNRALIAHLAHAIARDPEFGDFIPIFWSRKASWQNGRLFLIRPRYYPQVPYWLRIPHEDLVSIPETKLILWLSAYLERSGNVTRRDLIEALSGATGHQAQVAAGIDRLIELGLLVQEVPLPEDESSGVDGLIAFLNSIPRERAVQLRHSLEILRDIERDFPRVARDRRRSIRQARETYANALGITGNSVDADWTGPVLFEDVAEEPVRAVALPRPWRTPARDLLDFWSCYGALLDGNISFRETIGHIVRSTFSGRPVPFFEIVDFWKKSFVGSPAELRISDAYTPNPCGLAGLAGLAELRREFGRLIARSHGADDVDMREWAEIHGWVGRVRELHLIPPVGNAVCFSSHCQPVWMGAGEIGAVLNTFNNGPFRTLLRSCSALAAGREQLVQEIRAAVKKLWPAVEPCELFGRFDFNANLHPRVTDRRIVFGEGLLREEGDIYLKDLAFSVSSAGALSLLHMPSQTPVLPLDLGMMGSSFKPLLQHLLLGVANADAMLHSRPFHHYRFPDRERARGPVESFPRLKFGSLVLRRKGWSIASSVFSQGNDRESDFARFLRIRRSQRTLDLPREMFVCVETRPEHDRALSHRQHATRDKPQYMHFDNFFLVETLHHLIRDGATRLYCEELLPTRESWAKLGIDRPIEVVLDSFLPYEAAQAMSSTHAVPAFVPASGEYLDVTEGLEAES
jgi:lantibiotic biosynthesis dehydratase-like protein